MSPSIRLSVLVAATAALVLGILGLILRNFNPLLCSPKGGPYYIGTVPNSPFHKLPVISLPQTLYCPGTFTVGYNEAWTKSDYSNWLASNIPWNLPSAFNIDLVDAMFSGMAQGNAKIVRIFLFPNMQGVVIDPSTNPQTRGLTPELITNLTTVLQLARQYSFKIYITALEGDNMKDVANAPPNVIPPMTLRNYYHQLIQIVMNFLHTRIRF